MLHLTLLAVGTAQTVEWSWKVAVVMCACNLVALIIGRFAIQQAGASGMSMPGQTDKGIWERFGPPELLATMSFGHLLGAGMILGLANSGNL